MSKEEIFLRWLKSVLKLEKNTLVVRKQYNEVEVIRVIKEWLEKK